MHKHIDDVMRLSFYTFLVFLAATGLISVYFAKSAGVAILSAICFALSLFYYYSIRDRLELAGAILRSASLSLVAHPGPIYIAFSCMVLQLAWILAWCLGAVFILSSLGMLDITTMDTDIRGPKTVTVSHSLAVAGLLVSLYWTSQVRHFHGTTFFNIHYFLLPTFTISSQVTSLPAFSLVFFFY